MYRKRITNTQAENESVPRNVPQNVPQNEDLKERLKSTGSDILAECAVRDRIWGNRIVDERPG